MAIPLNKNFPHSKKKYYFFGELLTKTFCTDVVNMIILI